MSPPKRSAAKTTKSPKPSTKTSAKPAKTSAKPATKRPAKTSAKPAKTSAKPAKTSAKPAPKASAKPAPKATKPAKASVATKGGAAKAASTAADVDPHEHLSKVDEKLAQVIARAGRSPLTERGKEKFDGAQAFKALCHVIVSQQLSGKAADTIFGRVEALGGGTLPGPAELLAIPDERLRAAGLSGAKTRGVKDLAARVLDGSLELASLHAHDNDAVIEALTKVRGIGRWSAEMFLMFRMGRLDVLSTGDLGLRKGMMSLFGLRDLPDPATMERLSEHWRPYRSIACWYLWRVAEEGPPMRKKKPDVAKKAVEKKAVAKKAVAKKAVAGRAARVLAKR